MAKKGAGGAPPRQPWLGGDVQREDGATGREEVRRRKGKKKMVGPTFGGDLEGLQEWRVRGGIWRSMQNGGLFRGPARDGFLHQTSKFWSRAPHAGPRWRCSKGRIIFLSFVASFAGILYIV
jgi:hypothetical protein